MIRGDHDDELVCRVDLSPRMEDLLNEQIANELHASSAYLSMYAWCKRAGVALNGFASFFRKASDEERAHALEWIDYLNERGGTVRLGITRPPVREFGHVRDAIREAFLLEKALHEHLLYMHGDESADPHVQDFIAGRFLPEQTRAERELSDMYANLMRAAGGSWDHAAGDHGVYVFDRTYWNTAK